MTVQTPLQLVITIGIIALGTFLIRALPFFLFPAGKETPRVVTYLGAALPSASIAMLVVYCFKNVSVFSGSHGLPELISAVFVIVVHKWRHNLLLSIVGAFIGVRKYRDELPDNCLSYGKALGACTYLIAVASVIYGCFVFYLYRHHPELLENYLTSIETTFKEVYSDSAFTENMISMLKAFTTPATIAFAETFNKIFTGFIFSLLLAGLLRRTEKMNFI